MYMLHLASIIAEICAFKQTQSQLVLGIAFQLHSPLVSFSLYIAHCVFPADIILLAWNLFLYYLYYLFMQLVSALPSPSFALSSTLFTHLYACVYEL